MRPRQFDKLRCRSGRDWACHLEKLEGSGLQCAVACIVYWDFLAPKFAGAGDGPTDLDQWVDRYYLEDAASVPDREVEAGLRAVGYTIEMARAKFAKKTVPGRARARVMGRTSGDKIVKRATHWTRKERSLRALGL